MKVNQELEVKDVYFLTLVFRLIRQKSDLKAEKCNFNMRFILLVGIIYNKQKKLKLGINNYNVERKRLSENRAIY